MIRRRFERCSRLDESAEEVYGWHARPGALERLSPPWDPPVVESRSGGIADEGARVVLRVGPLRQRWVAEHYAVVPGREFHDRQVDGPFALWEHTHRMIPEGPEACTLEDRIEYGLPGGLAGDAVGGRAVHALLDRMFAYRHRVTADDLTAHRACRGGRAMKVAITGSSGLVGSALVPFLTTGGHEVVRLVRRAPREKDEVRWDPAAHTIDAAALEGVNAVAPKPVTNAAFTRTLGQVLSRPTIVPAPAFALRLAFGEMADAALLASIRVRPARLEASGYRFRFPDLEGALRHLLGRTA